MKADVRGETVEKPFSGLKIGAGKLSSSACRRISPSFFDSLTSIFQLLYRYKYEI